MAIGENPFCHTLADFFARLAETGLAPDAVKWLVIESNHITRSVRNYLRYDSIPAEEFDRFAADGGDLDPAQQQALEDQGLIISRVSNQRSDIDGFKADVVAAYEQLLAVNQPA